MTVDDVAAGMTTTAVVGGLRRERTRLLEAVDRLGPEATTVFVTEPGGWTAKDVLGHLIHYAGQIGFGLGAPLTPPAYVIGVTERLSGQEWNERSVAHWRDFSLGGVLVEFNSITDAIMERVALRSDDDMNATDAIPWAGIRPLWQIVGGDTFIGEWPAHASQIEAAAQIERS